MSAPTPSLAQRFKIATPAEIDPNQTILVIEDQQDMRIIMVHHLSKLGFKKSVQFQNGYEAVIFLRETKEKIAAIVCDTEMPVMNGYGLLQEIREDKQIDRPPFLLTMDNPSKEKIMLALENGVDEIMVKPFTLNDVIPKLASAFRAFHNPNNPEKVYELAKKLLRNGDAGAASKVYQALAAENQKSARPHVGLARAALMQKDTNTAIAELEKAEAKNPAYVHVYTTRGEILLAKSDLEGAVKNFVKAIELSPLNPLRYEDAAQPLFQLKRYDEGVRVLSIALANELNFPALHKYLSEGYYALRDYKNAVKHIKTALYAEPENVIFLNQLGISLKESGEFDESMKTYNQIIKLDNENRSAYYNKAVLQHTMKNTPEAIKTLEKAVAKFPDFVAAATKLVEYQKLPATPPAPQKAAS